MGLLRATGEFIGVCKKREPAVDLDTVADACASDESFAFVADTIEMLDAAPPPVPMMPVPQKAGLIEPKIFDPQVHLEILTELFGVYKGCEYTHSWECNYCDHCWITKSRTSDWDYDAVCPNCDSDDFSHEEWVGDIETSRTPTDDELECAMPEGLSYKRRPLLASYFAQLSGESGGYGYPLDLSNVTLIPLPKPEPEEYDESFIDQLPPHDEDFF